MAEAEGGGRSFSSIGLRGVSGRLKIPPDTILNGAGCRGSPGSLLRFFAGKQIEGYINRTADPEFPIGVAAVESRL
jgi:hypothetical protein